MREGEAHINGMKDSLGWNVDGIVTIRWCISEDAVMGKKKSDRDGGVGKIRKKAVLVEDDHIGTMMNHFEEKSRSFALLGDDKHLHEDVSFNEKKFNREFRNKKI
ncbi:hypothetical protein Tco_0194725 [Tanacetum coccineum]